MSHLKSVRNINARVAQLPADLHLNESKNKRFAFTCSILASMTSIMIGYDTGVTSGALIYIQSDLKINDVQLELLIGTTYLYSLFGSALAGKTSDWIGRKYTIVLAAALFFVGAILTGFAVNYGLLMSGRFVAGIAVGYALMIAPVYSSELAPTAARGFLTSFPEIFINFGVLLGYLSNWGFSKLSLNLGWRVMLGTGAIPSLLMGILVLNLMPESPRWLVMKGRLGEAKQILLKTSASTVEAELQLLVIQDAAGIPLDCTDNIVKVPKIKKGHEVWKELLLHPTPIVRRILLATIGIHFFQQASGIKAVELYSPIIFRKAGIVSESAVFGATMAVGFVKTFAVLISTFLSDKVGRRPLLLSSVGGMIVSVTLFAVGLIMVYQNPDKKIMWASLSTAMVILYVGFFSMGLGPIALIYSSEIFPLRLRAQGNSLGVGVNLLVNGIISMTFLSMATALTIGGTFFLFAGICIIAWLFCYKFLLETRGRNLEDMDALFGKKAQHSDENNNDQAESGTSSSQV